MLFTNLTFDTCLFKFPTTSSLTIEHCTFIKCNANSTAAAISINYYPYPCTLESCIFYACTSHTYQIISLSTLKSTININRICMESCTCLIYETYLLEVNVFNSKGLCNFTHSSISSCSSFSPFSPISLLSDINVSKCDQQNLFLGASISYSIFDQINQISFFNDLSSVFLHSALKFFEELHFIISLEYEKIIFKNCFLSAQGAIVPNNINVTFENCIFNDELNLTIYDNPQFNFTLCQIGSYFPTIEQQSCNQNFENNVQYVSKKQGRLTEFLHLNVDVREALFKDITTNLEGGGIVCQEDAYTFSIVHSSFVNCQASKGGGVFLVATITNFSKNCFKNCYAVHDAAFYLNSAYRSSTKIQMCSGDLPNKDIYNFDCIADVEGHISITQCNFSNVVSYTFASCLKMTGNNLTNSIFSNLRVHRVGSRMLNVINCFVVDFVPPNNDFRSPLFIPYGSCMNCSFYNVTVTTLSGYEKYSNCKTDNKLLVNASSAFVYAAREEFPNSFNDYCFILIEKNDINIYLYVIPPICVLCLIIAILIIYALRVRRIAKNQLKKSELERKILSDFG